MIVGTGSVCHMQSLGPLMYSLEDMAILRTLPGMRVLPCDSTELRLAMSAVLEHRGPAYIRIGKRVRLIFTPLLQNLKLVKLS